MSTRIEEATAMRIGVAGVTGRLGQLCRQEIEQTEGLTFAGGLARQENAALKIMTHPEELALLCDVVIDVSVASQVGAHAEAFTKAGCAWVIGTTGLDPEAEAAIRRASQTIPTLRAANFAPGVVILLEILRQLGAAFPANDYDADIIETHHRQKRDAPSGTALAFCENFALGRGMRLSDIADLTPNSTAKGPREDGSLAFASLRAGQIIGEHSLVLTSNTEQITLSHRALDRRVFAQGAVKAARWLYGREPGQHHITEAFAAPP